jgi:hypothetical protein
MFVINCQSSYISYINIHQETIVDLKTGILRVFSVGFIEVKRNVENTERA